MKRTKLTDKEKGDAIVKSLLEGGFSEENVADWIDREVLPITKSQETEEETEDETEETEEVEKGCGKKKSVKKSETEEETEETEEETEETEEETEDETEETEEVEKGGCVDKEGKPDIVKAIASDIYRRMKRDAAKQEKAKDEAIQKSINDIAERFEKSLNGMRQAIVAFGETAPKFKSSGLNRAIIEKSMGGGAKDENNKTVLSVSRDRSVVRELLEKAIDEEKDEAIQKSLREETTAYILDPVCGQVGETAARYMYEKKNVRLVK